MRDVCVYLPLTAYAINSTLDYISRKAVIYGVLAGVVQHVVELKPEAVLPVVVHTGSRCIYLLLEGALVHGDGLQFRTSCGTVEQGSCGSVAMILDHGVYFVHNGAWGSRFEYFFAPHGERKEGWRESHCQGRITALQHSRKRSYRAIVFPWEEDVSRLKATAEANGKQLL